MPDPLPESFETIRLTCGQAVATITLNRPQRLNAAPPLMFREIHAALQQLPALGARALLITGEGRAFCSGADLQGRDSGAGASRGATAHQALTESYAPTMQALARLGIPVICAVNGPAAGIGCSLALAADFTLAARSAYFLEAFVNIGLVPDGGTTWMLARQVGKARATEMLMLVERIAADKAEPGPDLLPSTTPSRCRSLRTGRTPGRRADTCVADPPGIARALSKALKRWRWKRPPAHADSADALEGGMAFGSVVTRSSRALTRCSQFINRP
jgi:hypothetical protein